MRNFPNKELGMEKAVTVASNYRFLSGLLHYYSHPVVKFSKEKMQEFSGGVEQILTGNDVIML